MTEQDRMNILAVKGIVSVREAARSFGVSKKTIRASWNRPTQEELDEAMQCLRNQRRQ
jgi:DeoR/GlpR family transcriptional regulator of sugar metabolism